MLHHVIADTQNLYPWQGANAIHSPFDSRLESQVRLSDDVDDVIREYTHPRVTYDVQPEHSRVQLKTRRLQPRSD